MTDASIAVLDPDRSAIDVIVVPVRTPVFSTLSAVVQSLSTVQVTNYNAYSVLQVM